MEPDFSASIRIEIKVGGKMIGIRKIVKDGESVLFTLEKAVECLRIDGGWMLVEELRK